MYDDETLNLELSNIISVEDFINLEIRENSNTDISVLRTPLDFAHLDRTESMKLFAVLPENARCDFYSSGGQYLSAVVCHNSTTNISMLYRNNANDYHLFNLSNIFDLRDPLGRARVEGIFSDKLYVIVTVSEPVTIENATQFKNRFIIYAFEEQFEDMPNIKMLALVDLKTTSHMLKSHEMYRCAQIYRLYGSTLSPENLQIFCLDMKKEQPSTLLYSNQIVYEKLDLGSVIKPHGTQPGELSFRGVYQVKVTSSLTPKQEKVKNAVVVYMKIHEGVEHEFLLFLCAIEGSLNSTCKDHPNFLFLNSFQGRKEDFRSHIEIIEKKTILVRVKINENKKDSVLRVYEFNTDSLLSSQRNETELLTMINHNLDLDIPYTTCGHINKDKPNFSYLDNEYLTLISYAVTGETDNPTPYSQDLCVIIRVKKTSNLFIKRLSSLAHRLAADEFEVLYMGPKDKSDSDLKDGMILYTPSSGAITVTKSAFSQTMTGAIRLTRENQGKDPIDLMIEVTYRSDIWYIFKNKQDCCHMDFYPGETPIIALNDVIVGGNDLVINEAETVEMDEHQARFKVISERDGEIYLGKEFLQNKAFVVLQTEHGYITQISNSSILFFTGCIRTYGNNFDRFPLDKIFCKKTFVSNYHEIMTVKNMPILMKVIPIDGRRTFLVLMGLDGHYTKAVSIYFDDQKYENNLFAMNEFNLPIMDFIITKIDYKQATVEPLDSIEVHFMATEEEKTLILGSFIFAKNDSMREPTKINRIPGSMKYPLFAPQNLYYGLNSNSIVMTTSTTAGKNLKFKWNGLITIEYHPSNPKLWTFKKIRSLLTSELPKGSKFSKICVFDEFHVIMTEGSIVFQYKQEFSADGLSRISYKFEVPGADLYLNQLSKVITRAECFRESNILIVETSQKNIAMNRVVLIYRIGKLRYVSERLFRAWRAPPQAEILNYFIQNDFVHITYRLGVSNKDELLQKQLNFRNTEIQVYNLSNSYASYLPSFLNLGFNYNQYQTMKLPYTLVQFYGSPCLKKNTDISMKVSLNRYLSLRSLINYTGTLSSIWISSPREDNPGLPPEQKEANITILDNRLISVYNRTEIVFAGSFGAIKHFDYFCVMSNQEMMLAISYEGSRTSFVIMQIVPNTAEQSSTKVTLFHRNWNCYWGYSFQLTPTNKQDTRAFDDKKEIFLSTACKEGNQDVIYVFRLKEVENAKSLELNATGKLIQGEITKFRVIQGLFQMSNSKILQVHNDKVGLITFYRWHIYSLVNSIENSLKVIHRLNHGKISLL